jgi:hypothetical protein
MQQGKTRACQSNEAVKKKEENQKRIQKVHSGPVAEDNSRVRPRLLPIFAEGYTA